MLKRNVLELLRVVLTPQIMSRFKFICGQESTRTVGQYKTKPVFIKSFDYISDKIAGYDPENVLLIDDSPYKTSFNCFTSSVYPDPYEGSPDDRFLKHVLFPFLQGLACGKQTIQTLLIHRYPNWSLRNLRKDWTEKKEIWTSQAIKNGAHWLHISRFKENNEE